MITISQEDVIASKLLNICEKHHLSNAAVDEVLEFTKTVCNQMSAKAALAVQHCAKENNMDTTSLFFQELPGILENLSSPLALIQASYRRQCYIDKNLPYGVSC